MQRGAGEDWAWGDAREDGARNGGTRRLADVWGRDDGRTTGAWRELAPGVGVLSGRSRRLCGLESGVWGGNGNGKELGSFEGMGGAVAHWFAC